MKLRGNNAGKEVKIRWMKSMQANIDFPSAGKSTKPQAPSSRETPLGSSLELGAWNLELNPLRAGSP
jgi:hypothetical protein